MTNLKFTLIFVIFSLFYSSQVASQSASCDYSYNEDYGYICKLTLKDSDGSTLINGQHLDDFDDGDVQRITTEGTGSYSTKVPADLCDKFENATRILMQLIGLKEIDELSFENCRNLEFLTLLENKFKKIPENCFASLAKLELLDLSYNEITELDVKSFVNLTSLNFLDLTRNKLKTLPNGIFAPLINLISLDLAKNEFTTLSFSWFDDAIVKLQSFYFNGNKLTSIDERIFDNNPKLDNIMGHLNPCVMRGIGFSIYEKDPKRPRIKAALKDCFSNYVNSTE